MCDLLSKDVWLENDFSSNYPKLMFFGTSILGTALLAMQIIMENGCDKTKIVSTSSLPQLHRILQYSAIFLLTTSLLMLLLCYTQTLEFKGLIVKIGIVVSAIVSVFVVSMVAAIQVEYSKINCKFETLIWFPTVALVLLTAVLAWYTFKRNTDVKINVPKGQVVSWENYVVNGALLEKIGQKQAKKCNLTLQPGESIYTFKSYLTQRKQLYAGENKGGFMSLFTASKQPPKLDVNKIPNIIKMNWTMKQNIQTAEQSNAYQKSLEAAGKDAEIDIQAIDNPEKKVITQLPIIRPRGVTPAQMQRVQSLRSTAQDKQKIYDADNSLENYSALTLAEQLADSAEASIQQGYGNAAYGQSYFGDMSNALSTALTTVKQKLFD